MSNSHSGGTSGPAPDPARASAPDSAAGPAANSATNTAVPPDRKGEAGLHKLIARARPRFRTATSLVHDTMRTAILTGTFAPGTALRQDTLAEAFDVSRMPVREALRQLEAEGLVEFIPNRGALVARAEPVEIAEVYEVRRLLEPHAIRQSVPRLNDVDLDRAEEVLEELDRERDVARWGELNRRFHLTLYAGCPGTHLVSIIEAQYFAFDRYVRLLLSSLDYSDASQDEHRTILAACRARDAGRAAAAIEQHLTEGVEDLLAFLRKSGGEAG